MQLYNDVHTENAKTIDSQACNPDWDCYYDRVKNKWIPYSLLPGECYSKQARVIGNISRGFFDKNSINKYLSWEDPEYSLVGLSMTIIGVSTAKYFNNNLAYEYLQDFIPNKFLDKINEINNNVSFEDIMKDKYYSLWLLNKKIDHKLVEI